MEKVGTKMAQAFHSRSKSSEKSSSYFSAIAPWKTKYAAHSV